MLLARALGVWRRGARDFGGAVEVWAEMVWRRCSLRLLGETREAEEWAWGCAREGVKAVACVLSASKKDRRRLEQGEARSAGGTSPNRGVVHARKAKRRPRRLGTGVAPGLMHMGRGTVAALDWATAIRRESPARGREIERRFSRAHLSVTSGANREG